MEPVEITNIEILQAEVYFEATHFASHVTSINTGSVQVTQRAVGTRTMHGFGTDLVRNQIAREPGLGQLICISW